LTEALADLKNNKSRRVQASNEESLKVQRKWMGSIKTALGAKSGDLCLRVTLEDLSDVESKGRWWISGAAWKSREDQSVHPKNDTVEVAVNTEIGAPEQALLEKLAAKLRMTTPVRRSIFMVHRLLCVFMTYSIFTLYLVH
jgi:nucleolar MIF4G domain-containing protein 1